MSRECGCANVTQMSRTKFALEVRHSTEMVRALRAEGAHTIGYFWPHLYVNRVDKSDVMTSLVTPLAAPPQRRRSAAYKARSALTPIQDTDDVRRS
jgi:hypothetical protein